MFIFIKIYVIINMLLKNIINSKNFPKTQLNIYILGGTYDRFRINVFTRIERTS